MSTPSGESSEDHGGVHAVHRTRVLQRQNHCAGAPDRWGHVTGHVTWGARRGYGPVSGQPDRLAEGFPHAVSSNVSVYCIRISVRVNTLQVGSGSRW